MSKLRALQRPIDPNFIAGLEEIIRHARSGELRGAVVLLSFPKTYAHWQGGEISFETAVTSLESWKWQGFSKRFPR